MFKWDAYRIIYHTYASRLPVTTSGDAERIGSVGWVSDSVTQRIEVAVLGMAVA